MTTTPRLAPNKSPQSPEQSKHQTLMSDSHVAEAKEFGCIIHDLFLSTNWAQFICKSQSEAAPEIIADAGHLKWGNEEKNVD